MPYDPQRSRTRPQVAETEPAPVEALLDPVAVPDEPVEPATVGAGRGGLREVIAAGDEASGGATVSQLRPVAPATPTTSPSPGKGSPTKPLVLVAALATGLGLAWLLLRRRRARRSRR